MDLSLHSPIVDRIFLFGKHYGRTYSQVYADDPQYSLRLTGLLRTLYRESLTLSPEEQKKKSRLINDIKDYLLYSRSRHEVESKLASISAGPAESSIPTKKEAL